MRMRGRGNMNGPLTRGMRRGGYARNEYIYNNPSGYMEMRPYPKYYDIVYYDDYIPERMERGYNQRNQQHHRQQHHPNDQYTTRGGPGPKDHRKMYNEQGDKQTQQRGDRLPGFRGGMAMRGQNQMQFIGGRNGLSGPIPRGGNMRGDARAQERGDMRGGHN